MKLSDTQLVILNTACRRADRRVLPLPANLKGGAAEKVIGSLIAKGLVEEVQAELGDLVWRIAENDQRLALVLTPRASKSSASRRSRGRSRPQELLRPLRQSQQRPKPAAPRGPRVPTLRPRRRRPATARSRRS
ncbi:hypothetical protein MesoLjLc_48670 [Mesorhizobium sp. L-8-10]|uniref:hypothetical protein n=1 Tax=Mesorhizobium sp. L-8-10 TaxID=2744523 RepID=UPI0019253B79|nr:hypothetical protein [Mesorhizobium sp. L-8-10]BCH32937.1 hypothetical protein MesoLjLc_48670 [Mesorhizobium sp. L-8-10]